MAKHPETLPAERKAQNWIFLDFSPPWPVTFPSGALLFWKENAQCVYKYVLFGMLQDGWPYKDLFSLRNWIENHAARSCIVPLIMHQASLFLPFPTPLSPDRPIMEMVSKWHQVIPWRVPTALLSHKSRWQRWRFLQRRGSWFGAGVRLPDFQVHGHTPLTTTGRAR